MCSTQDNNLSDNEVIIIAVCGSVAGIIISKEMHFEFIFHACIYFAVILALIAVLLIRRQRRKSHYNGTIMLKSYTKSSTEDSNNHECFYSNPTYQHVQPVQPDNNNIIVSPNPTFQDAKQGDDIDISPNPTFEDSQEKIDNEFSIQLKN